MSRDFALLFPAVRTPRREAVSKILSLLSPIGARYRGGVSRLDYGPSERFWRLSTQSRTAKSLSDINALFDSWDGLTLELESKFGPVKLMVWKEQEGGGTGFGLFETSHVFVEQAEDPDICDIFDEVALAVCRVMNCDAFVLVGDPGIRSVKREEIISWI